MTFDERKAKREALQAARLHAVLTVTAANTWVKYKFDPELQ